MTPQGEKSSAHWKVLFRNEDGTALALAIIASLLLLVFALSFSSLANLEGRIGINDYRSRQAQLVGEAGFEAVRNHLRPVVTDYTNFLGNTYTSDPNASPQCTTGANGTANGVPCTTTGIFAVSTGRFTIRVDNDPQDPGVATNTDQNGQVILTSLGTTALGNGRAQSRVQVLLDDPFKHVCASDDVQSDCSTYTGDNPCTPMGIYVEPCQPEDPHGPKVFPGLPAPTTIGIPVGDGRRGCIPNWVTAYQAENPLNQEPVMVVGNTNAAQSYFDMAIGIDGEPLRAAGWIPDAPAGRNRHGWCPVVGVNNCFDGNVNPNAVLNTLGCGLVIDEIWTTPNAGVKYINQQANAAGETAPNQKVVVYVTRTINTGNNTHVQGTVVVHGDNIAGNSDVSLSPRFCLNRLSSGIDCGARNDTFSDAPGYPFAVIVHHPGIGAGDPPPQNTLAQLSSTNVYINGIIFSSGNVEFNPIQVEGGVVAYGVDIQGSSNFVYNNSYGAAAKKGFSIPPGAYSAQFMRSTWLHCRQTDPNNDFVNPNTTPTCN